MLRRVLIANRGEIAVRVIRACRELNIESVAVYSDADADAPHVHAATAAVCIGPAPAHESYLNIPAIIAAAAMSGADAIHPGYGFLSENADFAAACIEAGLIFVGPPADVIRRMGSKIGARDMMRAAGVPVVPGETPTSQTDEAIADAVNRVGFPALLKASAGGGGKGMRIVRSATDVPDAITTARREATRAFVDGSLYVERLIDHPRHIEVQVFADTHGSVVHFFERDCTLQRRHQKVVEESPAPRLSPAVRARLTTAATAAARAAGYINAGTIEFMLEGEGDAASFYFLEMNTRLQVEHPITEAVTGIDLVQTQLRVASGEPLPFTQAEISTRGHAMECRIYAEDPSHGMLPQTGRLLVYREPSGDGIRVDSGVREGQTITVHYDPMLAKLIAFGDTRADAIARMRDALASFAVLGLRHNIAFLHTLLGRDEVRDARVHTGFIEEHLGELTSPPDHNIEAAAAALAAITTISSDAALTDASEGSPIEPPDPWQTLGRMDW